MNAIQENKLSMYLAVQKVCSANNGIWTGLPSFADAFSDFETNLSLLQEALEAQESNITGFTREKESLEEILVDKAIAVARSVFAYAEKENNKPLREKVNYAPSYLRNTRDTARIQICQVIHDEADKVIDDLGDYGVDANGLKKLQKAIDDYQAAVASPRNATTEKKKATVLVNRLYGVIDGIMKGRMDMLTENFKKENLDFYKQFFNARQIITLGSRNTILKGIVKNGKADFPVIAAKVEFIINGGEENERISTTETNKAGEFLFENVPTGEHKLKVSKEGFEPAEIEKLIIERGRVNEVSLSMKQVQG